MFRCLRLAALLGGLCGSAFGFDISVVGGGTLGSEQVTAGAPYPFGIGFVSKSGIAFGGGALLAVPLMESVLDLELGALMMPRKNTLVASGPALASEISSEETMPTFQVPVMIRLNLIKIISLGGGVYYWWGTGMITQASGGSSSSHTWSDAGYNARDYGFTASVAVTMPILPKLGLRLDARYLYGMTNLSTTSGITYETRDLQILAGLQLML
jgi:hypothetical protein